MIESYYWRQELRADIRWLRDHQTYRRWSEKQMVLFERRLILAAFQVRVLIEQKRVRSAVSNSELQCAWYRKVGKQPVTRLNSYRLEQHFALDSPETVRLDAWNLSNQLIHHYEMCAASNGRQFAAVLVFSDRARNTGLYAIPVPELLDYLASFADDRSAVSRMASTWNAKKQDYDVVAD